MTTISASIPAKQPDNLIKLAQDIMEKHLELGVNSPLNVLDMTLFNNQIQLTRTKRTASAESRQLSEASMQQANIALGIDKGQIIQTPETVYYYITQVRDQLLAIHKGEEEMISKYGFNVVISEKRRKRFVKVDIPVYSPDKLIKLTQDVLRKHQSFPPHTSPLDSLNMTDLDAKLHTAITERTASIKARETSEKLMLQSNKALGIAKDQTSFTPKTVYNIITKIRKILLVTYKGDEEALSEFGFNVVISNPVSKGTPATASVKIKTNGGPVNLGVRLLGIIRILWGDNTTEDFTGDPNATNFIDKVYALAKLYTILITGAFSEIIELHINNSNLTYIKLHKSMKKLQQFIAQGNMFSQEVVDDILITINRFGTSNGVINLLGSASPSAKGLAAIAELQARGWTVLTN